MESGLEERGRALGSAASAYFGVFHELMADHFTSLCETVLAMSKNTTKSSVVPVELEERLEPIRTRLRRCAREHRCVHVCTDFAIGYY